MSGCLLANYELSQKKAINGSLPADGALIKTIVTTNLADAIAKGIRRKTDRSSDRIQIHRTADPRIRAERQGKLSLRIWKRATAA